VSDERERLSPQLQAQFEALGKALSEPLEVERLRAELANSEAWCDKHWEHNKEWETENKRLKTELAAARERVAELSALQSPWANDMLIQRAAKAENRAEQAEARVRELENGGAHEELSCEEAEAVIERLSSEGSRLQDERDEARKVLLWLDIRGGLGLDVHERIHALLAPKETSDAST
jgi:hypothetical protein